MDSVTHVNELLIEKNRGKATLKKVYYTDDLKQLSEKADNVHYFGVLTLGDNEFNVVLKSESDRDICTISKNSQIIEMFSNLEYTLPANSDIKGHFRGFQIVLR